jgi:hypothetical protein
VPSGDGGNLWTVLVNATNGVAVMSANGTFSYTPTANYNGPDTFTYQVCDADNDCSSTTVTIAVGSVVLPVRLLDPMRLGDDFVFSFETQPNHTYTVEYLDALATQPWTTLTNLVGSGSNVTFTNTISTSGARFYRVTAQ